MNLQFLTSTTHTKINLKKTLLIYKFWRKIVNHSQYPVFSFRKVVITKSQPSQQNCKMVCLLCVINIKELFILSIPITNSDFYVICLFDLYYLDGDHYLGVLKVHACYYFTVSLLDKTINFSDAKLSLH